MSFGCPLLNHCHLLEEKVFNIVVQLDKILLKGKIITGNYNYQIMS